MFVGRQFELAELNRLYDTNEFQFVVVYGRRRVGKTTLLMEFCRGKPTIFHVADETVGSVALERFSRDVFQHFGLKGVSSFRSWEDAFEFLAEKARSERLVLVIDEFRHVANACKELPSVLQRCIDLKFKKTKLFLILCGSYVSFMEKEVLGYESPLYGRRTAQFEINPLSFLEAKEFFPKYSIEQRVVAYAILGGTPQYLETFSDEVDPLENVRSHVLRKSSYLYEEPLFLLRQELREPKVYNSILEAIASGRTRLNEISTKIGVEVVKLSKYLDTLMGLKLIERVSPLPLGKSAREGLYRIKDNFFKFWYRFVFPNRELIEQGLADKVLEEKLRPHIGEYVGRVFEGIAVQYLWELNKKGALPFRFERIGKWWGNNPIKRRQEEVDVVAYDEENVLLCECKWQNEPVGLKEVNELMERGSLFDFKRKYYVFFSKAGFSEEVLDLAKSYPLILIALDRMDSP